MTPKQYAEWFYGKTDKERAAKEYFDAQVAKYRELWEKENKEWRK
jgi:hypothetical protein